MNNEQLEKATELKKKYDQAKAKLHYCENIKPEANPIYSDASGPWTSSMEGLTIAERLLMKKMIHAMLTEHFSKAEKEFDSFKV